MSRVYDNWERLVEATLDREKLRELALADSRESSFRSSVSSNSSSGFDVEFNPPDYIATAGFQGCLISEPTHLTYQVIKAADAATLFKGECLELKHKTQILDLLLQQVAACASDLYDLPTCCIMDDTHEVLHQALILITKYKGGGDIDSFRAMSSKLEHSIRSVSWFLCNDEYNLGLTPIATDEPILYHTWRLIAILHTGSDQDRCNTASSLISLVRDHHLYRKLIVKKGGVRLLSKLLKEGTIQGQENAARALGVLVKDPKSVDDMIKNKIWDQFCGILEKGPMKVQSAVAWVISEIAKKGHLIFFLEGRRTVQLLVSHLAFHGVQENTNHAAVSNFPSNNGKYGAMEKEDPVLKAYIYAMAARTLGHLVKLRNYNIRRNIVNSSAVSHLAVLIDKGPKESRYIFMTTLLEITELAQKYAIFRSYLSSNSLPREAIVDALFRVLTYEMENSELSLPCIKVIGNLAQSFGAIEIRMISLLVKLLHYEQKTEVSKEACITLFKFVRFLNLVYCKEILIANGAKYLVRLVRSGDEIVQIHALILLCIFARRVPKSKQLADAGVLNVFSMALEHEFFKENKDVKRLLPLAARKFGITVPEDLAEMN